MCENQNIEYKQCWKDDYLKWICGFANSSGGRLYIGVNDKGEVIGLSNSRKLITDIPNKVKDTLGIIVDVNLLNEFGKEYIEIKVKKSSYKVNYNIRRCSLILRKHNHEECLLNYIRNKVFLLYHLGRSL